MKPFMFSLSVVMFFALNSFAQTKRDAMDQYIADLQKNPFNNSAGAINDYHYSLLEKIIKISTDISPLPAIPEEARKKYIMAITLRDEAKKKEDYSQPIVWLQEARTVAPWWPDIYKELGLTNELAGNYTQAIQNLQWYLLTKPTEQDTRAAQDEIYKITAKEEKAVKNDEENNVIKKLVGLWAIGELSESGVDLNHPVLIQGKIAEVYRMQQLDESHFELFSYTTLQISKSNGKWQEVRDGPRGGYRITGSITGTTIRGKIFLFYNLENRYDNCRDQECIAEGEVQQEGRTLMFKWFQEYSDFPTVGNDHTQCSPLNKNKFVYFYRQ